MYHGGLSPPSMRKRTGTRTTQATGRSFLLARMNRQVAPPANLHADRRLIGGDPADNRAQEADVQENASGIWQGAAHECWYSARCFSDDFILSDAFASSIAGFMGG